MSYSLEEQETIIRIGRADNLVHIWTSHSPHLNRLRKLKQERDYIVELEGDEFSASFTVPIENYKPFGAIRNVVTRVLSEEQRQAAVERLRKARETKE